jgi:glycerate kinase
VDYVFTGEGKIDGQSLRGKVVMGVARRCKQKGVPVIAVVGGAESDLTDAYNQGVTSIFTINKLPQDFSISRNYSSENLAFTMENILRLISLK